MTNEEINQYKKYIVDASGGAIKIGVEQFEDLVDEAINAIQENSKLKAENEEYKKSLLRITQELEYMLSQIMEKACSNCDLKVGLCSECYRYEMCLKALRGDEND